MINIMKNIIIMINKYKNTKFSPAALIPLLHSRNDCELNIVR